MRITDLFETNSSIFLGVTATKKPVVAVKTGGSITRYRVSNSMMLFMDHCRKSKFDITTFSITPKGDVRILVSAHGSLEIHQIQNLFVDCPVPFDFQFGSWMDFEASTKSSVSPENAITFSGKFDSKSFTVTTVDLGVHPMVIESEEEITSFQ